MRNKPMVNGRIEPIAGHLYEPSGFPAGEKGSYMKRVLILIAFLIVGCASQEQMMVRQMEIKNIDINEIRDGDHIGSFSYGGFKYEVKTIVADHKIKDIVILHNRDTKHARRAEGVVTEILEDQTPNVDVISGATTTSKALMKAVENSLSTGIHE
jgi:uncharacterized protein with FMN-binding domain